MIRRIPFVLPIASGRQQAIINATPFSLWIAAVNDAPSFQDELHWVQIVDPGDPEAEPPIPPQIRIWRMYFKRVSTTAIPGTPSAGNEEKWTIYLLLPKGVIQPDGTHEVPWNIGAKMIRGLRRWLNAHAAQNQDAQGRPYMLPPMTIQQVHEQYPAYADAHFRPQQPVEGGEEGETEPVPGSELIAPIVVGGDDPEQLATIDYRPSDEDCDNDVEVDPDTLWPPVP